MNSSDSETARHVVLPQWLPFKRQVLTREANEYPGRAFHLDADASISAFKAAFEDFKANPTPFLGSELLGVAETLCLKDEAEVLAQYVSSEPILGSAANWHASTILRNESAKGGPQAISVEKYKSLLAAIKERSRFASYDPMAWVEQARLYTILSQFEKARRAIKIALHLAPSHRFVVRSAIRFYAHWGDWEEALVCGRRAYSLNPDPLIFGPLLSVYTQLKKTPLRLKSILNDALLSDAVFLNSETLEAAGTLEIFSGSEQRSKRLFKRAWIDPTHAVISHSQWVLREHYPQLASGQNIAFNASREAMAWIRFIFMDFNEAANAAHEWCLEEPYSARPAILGSNAASLVEDYNRAEEICRAGLIANPDNDVLLNNLAFMQLRLGKIDEAEQSFYPILKEVDDENEVAVAATFGLIQMHKGHVDEGISLYSLAIQRAMRTQDRKMAVRATMHLIISLFDIAKRIDPALLESAATGLRNVDDAASLTLAKTVLKRMDDNDIPDLATVSDAVRKLRKAVDAEEYRYHESLLVKALQSSS